MVTLPREFTATKFPGYFWNTKTKKLFSIKIGGELREMKVTQPSWKWSPWADEPFYRVSHKGRNRVLKMEYLTELKTTDSQITVVNRHVHI